MKELPVQVTWFANDDIDDLSRIIDVVLDNRDVPKTSFRRRGYEYSVERVRR